MSKVSLSALWRVLVVGCLAAGLASCGSGGDGGGDGGTDGGDGGGTDGGGGGGGTGGGGGGTVDNPAFRSSGLLAFATAEGFGRDSKGGRGGAVLHVTNLNDSGPGSLRAAVEASGARTVVFDVGGTIRLRSRLQVSNPRLTIAGQTAPGGGIAIRDEHLNIVADDVIIRYLRSRVGSDYPSSSNPDSLDAISVQGGTDIIIDHCSASWGIDECLSVVGENTGDVTVQWCIISEGLNDAGHSSGEHSRGSLVSGAGGSRYSFHHNLWAHCQRRMPEVRSLVGSGADPVGILLDFRNNVLYNWGSNEAGSNLTAGDEIASYNFIGNHYQSGINTDASTRDSFPFVGPSDIFDEQSAAGAGYFTGNYYNGKSIGDDYNRVLMGDDVDESAYKATPKFSTSGGGVETSNGADAYLAVLGRAGATLPDRDSVDDRVVMEVSADIGRIIDNEAAVGGYPALAKGTTLVDTDGDGMPDDWEVSKGLNRSVRDHNGTDLSDRGYTNLEVYLADIAAEVLP